MALIKASGARLAILPDHALLTKWRKYSQERYRRLSVPAEREEVFRFITWTNAQSGINEEIVAAMHNAVARPGGVRTRAHGVRALNGQLLIESRLG